MATDRECKLALELEEMAAMGVNMHPGEDNSLWIRLWVLARKHRGLPTGLGDWNAALKAWQDDFNAALKAQRDEEGADD